MSPPSVRDGQGREVFIEIVILGAYAKVSAIDAATGIEVSLAGPAHASRASLQKAVLDKLNHVLKKKSAP